MKTRIAIVGGGAAGLAAAIAAAWQGRLSQVPLEVRVYERDDRVGRSILATGNGRCNFSNAQIDAEKYYGAAFVAPALAALDSAGFWPRREAGENPALAFFEDLGLSWREEGEGRLYPVTGKASTVLDVLRAAAAALGVQECCNAGVKSIELPREAGKPFTLRMADGAFQRAEQVICAVGGKVSQDLLPSSLSFSALAPCLGPLATDTKDIRGLDNIRVRGTAALERDKVVIAQEQGEVLFRKYGLSGIAIFNLSRFAQPGDVIALDLLPHVTEEEAFALLANRAAFCKSLSGVASTCEDALRGLFLPLVGEALLKPFGLKPEDAATDDALHRVACIAKRFKVTVQGMADPKQCQVHRGGVPCSCMDPATMEVLDAPGLYVVGEALDVDGPCGGYNLHWAWTSGLLAGCHAAKKGPTV